MKGLLWFLRWAVEEAYYRLKGLWCLVVGHHWTPAGRGRLCERCWGVE